VRMKENKNTVKCLGCGKLMKWTGMYGSWCVACKPREPKK
jgi:hypothetical protein